jgi:hypothetical protein
MPDITVSLTPSAGASIDLTPPSYPATVTLSAGSTGPGVPAGGTERQLIQKASATDFDAEWTSDILVDSVQFDGGTGTQGTVTWDVDEQTLELVYNSAVLHVGQDMLYQVRNGTASQITKGTVVMATGTIGNSGKITIGPMDGTSVANAKFLLGIATENIAAGADGKVTSFGKIRQLNTASYVDGDVLYVSTATAGALTKTEPISGLKLPIAFVIHAHSNGTLMVRAGNGSAIRDQHDVTLTSIATNDILMRDGANWVNKTPAQVRDIYDLVIGTDVQAYDAGLQSIAGLTTAADRMIYTTALDTYAVTTLTSFARTLLDDTDAATARTTLGAGTVTSVAGTGTVNGITLTGTVTASGSLTLGGTLSGVSLTTQVSGTLPVANGGTGITAFGTGVATVLATPSSANLAAAITDETGTGALVFAGSPALTGTPTIDGALVPTIARTTTVAKAIRVALLASASVRAPQVLDDADLDMGTNNFSVVVQKRITTTRPAANEILYHKHDGTTGVIVTLLTTGIVRLTLNATTFDSTTALTSASNVEPVIIIPVTRETTTAAGSVTFVVDGVQLGSALVISARVEEIVNGNFDSGITGWTLAGGSGGTVTWSSGKMRVERVAVNTAAYQAISLAAGETLFVKATVSHVSGAAVDCRIRLYSVSTVSSGSSLADGTTYENGAAGVSSLSYTSATAQTVYLQCLVFGGDGIYDFDTITSLNTYSVDNASNLYLLGTSTTTTEGSYYDSAIYNRALSVTECLAYCLRGPDVGDFGGNQTQLITGDSSNFEGGTVGSWVGNSGAGTVAVNSTSPISGTYDLKITSTVSTNAGGCLSIGPLAGGRRYRLTLSYIAETGATWSMSFRVSTSGGASTVTRTDVSGSATITSDSTLRQLTLEFVPDATTTTVYLLFKNSAGSIKELFLDNVTLQRVGITGHWPAFNAQTNTGQIFDQSGNKNHMLLPASGATILGDRRPDVQLTWENTWAATSELQYFPGVNQAVYPTNFYIEGIILTPSATTTAGFTIGNGSNASYYATVSGPLTSGVPVFVPLTNRYSDGTNLKLTITPMATTTCTLATTVFGRLLGGF